MIGMMMSATKDVTIEPNAAPMITPTARSTTLPRMANFLNSSSIVTLPQRRPEGTRRHPAHFRAYRDSWPKCDAAAYAGNQGCDPDGQGNRNYGDLPGATKEI